MFRCLSFTICSAWYKSTTSNSAIYIDKPLQAFMKARKCYTTQQQIADKNAVIFTFCALRQRLFAISNAVLIKEIGINLIVSDKLVSKSANKCGVGTWTNCDPFINRARSGFI